MPNQVTVNGASLSYVQLGPTHGADHLVMVHGLATNLAFWYAPYAVSFAQRFRVTLFDLRGHGRSAMTEGGHTPQEQSTDLAALLDHLEIDRAHFVAHSFGGVVALGLACRAPTRVRSLVLADSQVSFMRKLPTERWRNRSRVARVLSRHAIDLDIDSPTFGYELLTRIAERLLEGKSLPDDVVELVGPALGRLQRRTARRWLDLVERARHALMSDDGLTPHKLGALDMPIMAMYGEHSRACATSSVLRELWPLAQFVTIPEAGHFFPTTRSDEVMAACEWFWAREGLGRRPSSVAI
ncbi:MAG: alpha/beta hydrolase [Myxococcota bacterium]